VSACAHFCAGEGAGGTVRVLPVTLSRLTTAPRRIWERLPPELGEKAKEEALRYKGYSCNADGSRLPLGPELEVRN
jgi:hypothetical protein